MPVIFNNWSLDYQRAHAVTFILTTPSRWTKQAILRCSPLISISFMPLPQNCVLCKSPAVISYMFPCSLWKSNHPKEIRFLYNLGLTTRAKINRTVAPLRITAFFPTRGGNVTLIWIAPQQSGYTLITKKLSCCKAFFGNHCSSVCIIRAVIPYDAHLYHLFSNSHWQWVLYSQEFHSILSASYPAMPLV